MLNKEKNMPDLMTDFTIAEFLIALTLVGVAVWGVWHSRIAAKRIHY